MAAESSDFIPVSELARLTGRRVTTLYNDNCKGSGPLAPIMTKFGGRIGVWRADYEMWRDSQRKLKGAA